MQSGPSITIITPTYNERGNISRLVENIFNLSIPRLDICIVDDNSPDNTGKVADELSKKYPVSVIHRNKKTGLGLAYADAFKEILKKNPDYIIQMDADLSHDPKVIPEMLSKIKSCDLVLGSRYIEGGKIENWGNLRKLVSFLGNIYARALLRLPIKDLTGGFKCYRREALEKLDFNSLDSVGYNFQIETTYRIYKNGGKVCEIPITFTERKTGSSKFNLGIIMESFIKVFLLRIRG